MLDLYFLFKKQKKQKQLKQIQLRTNYFFIFLCLIINKKKYFSNRKMTSLFYFNYYNVKQLWLTIRIEY